MKRILTALCVLAAALAAFAAPQISWMTMRHNFGAFDEDNGIVTCKFKFVNTGDEPLTVLAARASCGCTQPSYPTEAVAPGDTAEIVVAYNPTGRPGRFTKSIYIDTNTEPKRSKLTITGVVIGAQSSVAGRYPVDMGALKFKNGSIMFGQVTKPHMKTVFAEAYNRSADSVRLRVASKPSYIDINFEPKTVGPGEQVSVICYFRSNGKNMWGLVEDSVRFTTGAEEFVLPLTAIVNEDFSKLSAADREKAPVAKLSTESADFGRVDRDGGTVSRTVELTNEGKNTLEIRRVYTADPGVSVEVDKQSLKKGKSAIITISVDPKLLPGALLNSRISVITNDPDHPVQTLRAVGEL